MPSFQFLGSQLTLVPISQVGPIMENELRGLSVYSNKVEAVVDEYEVKRW